MVAIILCWYFTDNPPSGGGVLTPPEHALEPSAFTKPAVSRGFRHKKTIAAVDNCINYCNSIVAADGNDYNANFKPGTAGTDDTGTFAGGLYGVMKKIQKASDIRVQSGKKETAVIMVSTTYSNRRGDFSNHNNRYTTENSVGYTLDDFRKDMLQ